MSEDEDWFERALREIEGESGATGGEEDESEDESAEDSTDVGGTAEKSPEPADSTGADVEDGAEAERDAEPPESLDEPEGFAGAEEPAEEFGGGGGAPGGGGDEFGFADFGGGDGPDADSTAPDTGRSEPDAGGTTPGAGGDEFGFTDFGDEEDGGPGGGFGGGGEGFGGGGFGGGTDFDEEEFESDIERIDLGIEGLDDMILGGVPRRSLIAAIGSAGTGKTTFALQFLHEALRNGDKAVYITLEESREAILSTAEEKGWPFREYEREGLLAVVALDPIEMANSLASIRNDLSRLISEFGAERLVLDSVSLLEMMYDHPAKRRSEVFDFTRSLKEAGVTTMLTSEASEENAYASRHGIVEYLTDAVFVLQYVRPSDFRETRLAVEIQKIRDANHSRETKPYEITDHGISVYQQANIF